MTVFNTPVLTPFAKLLALSFLKINGWRKEGGIPDTPKLVLIGAPHTSNWDVPFVLSLAFAFGVPIKFMMKESVFRWPFGGFFRWLGGIPIDRSKRNGVVAQTIELFNNSERLIICIPPEGTRKKSSGWKSGFYHIAYGAGIPISLGFMDFKRKAGGFGPLLWPTGDIAADMAIMRDYYIPITGKRPEHRTLPEVPEQE
jgi:1-acyl-sn-glycerol-3-phosphate acyltransferase